MKRVPPLLIRVWLLSLTLFSAWAWAVDTDGDGILDGPSTKIGTGMFHTCALDATGVHCWGNNAYGQITVPALVNPVALSVGSGSNHSCALDAIGLHCWGNQMAATPTLANPVAVSVGYGHTCAIDDTGLHCWGFNAYGQTDVPILVNPVAVSAGGGHTCAIDDNGLHCWGNDRIRVRGWVNHPVAVSSGGSHTCVLDDKGVHCRGKHFYDQTTVPALLNPVAVSAGWLHTCALDQTGVHCWGNNTNGQTTVPVLLNPVVVSAGSKHTCAVDATGVHCWGDNSFGQTTVPPLTLADNCPTIPNANQLDTDADGIGDVCDAYIQTGASFDDNLGSAIAMADMNNDGFDDLIIGSPHKDISSTKKYVGEIKIISGSDGAVLNAFIGTKASARFGSALAVVEDQNSDGVPDLIVGSPLYDSSLVKKDNGKVELYSGADGVLLQTIVKGSRAGDQLGAAVAVADIDNNGEPNLIVGASRKDFNGLKNAGQVTVYSGINNTILYQRSGTQAGERFGSSIAVDEDQYQLLVGSPFYDVNNGSLLSNAGRVTIFDGADGVSAALFTRDGSTAGNNFGSSVASFSEDLDDDTFNEWAVGSSLADPAGVDAGKVEVFSGFNATAFVIVDGATAGDHFGAALATGDINNDGENDLAIGSPLFDVPPVDAGRVEVLSGALF